MRAEAADIAYVTDLEGMWDKLESFVDGNPLVSMDAGGRLQVRAGAVFVYGGDAVDRGPGARRLVATLLEAKRRLGDQVVLLAGNRDINKLRLPRELAGEPPVRTPAEMRSAPRPQLLRWIFEHTMGAKGAFEFRQAETGERDEEAVVDSFLADLAEGGELRAYLAACQLGYRRGRTLFLHGGISEHSLGAVPGQARAATPAQVDVDDWVARLNSWYREQIGEFCAERLDASGRPAWAPLVAYQAPVPGTRNNPESVVYGRLADAHNNLHLPGAEVIDALRAHGVRRVVIGHTPSGDCPAILRDRGFELICADNSHARHRVGSKLYLHDEWLRVDARARLDGAEAASTVAFALAADDAGAPIGRRTREHGRLVKGPLDDTSAWLCTRALPEWKIEQLAVAAAALAPDALEAPY